MSTLTDQLAKRLAFDEDMDSTDADDEAVKYLHEPRLKPLHEKLLKCVEVLDCLVARYEDAQARDANASILNRGCSLGIYTIVSKALAELRKECGE